MAEYTKVDVITFAGNLYDFLKGLRDGWSVDDMQQIVKTMMQAPAVTNEFKEDWDAAGLHMISELTGRFGDDRINPKQDGG